MRFITAYCYVYIAMQGSGFCRSCVATFGLIMSSPAQLSLNSFVRMILGFIQIFGTTGLCGWVANSYLRAEGRPEPLYPAGLAALCAYVLASSFALVFSCALDTLFVCCVRDKAEYSAAFMSDELHQAFGFDKSDRRARKKTRREQRAMKSAAEADGGSAPAEEAAG